MPAAPLSQFSHGEYSTWFRHDRYPGQANHHAGSAGFLNQQPEELNKFNPSVFSLMAHPEQKLSVSAFAETRPKFPNVDSDNEPITENQAKNRRVVVHILNMTATEMQ